MALESTVNIVLTTALWLTLILLGERKGIDEEKEKGVRNGGGRGEKMLA